MESTNNDQMQERLLNAITDGIIITDQSGTVTLINHAALQMLSIRRDDIVGRQLSSRLIIQTEDGQSANIDTLLIKPVVETKKSVSISSVNGGHYFFVRNDRTLFPVTMSGMPVQPYSQSDGVTIIFHDLTAQQKIDQSKSEFISLISHQLRTPVNIVSWYAEKLVSQKKGELNEKQKEYLNEIMVGNKRIVDLVTAVVNVSRTDLGRLKNKQESVELIPVIKEAIKQLQASIDQKNLILEENYGDKRYTLLDSDREYLAVISHNVISNAVRYTAEGGQITIALTEIDKGAVLDQARGNTAAKAGVILSVKDNGLGIPDEQKEQLFKKLFRADNVKALDVTGIGLGLYVTRNFVESLDGQIWFKSKVREGSTFYVYIPY